MRGRFSPVDPVNDLHGVVVTASHNRAPDNGNKLWTELERASGDEHNDRITEVTESASFDFTGHDVIAKRRDAEAATDSDAVDLFETERELVKQAGERVGYASVSAVTRTGTQIR